MVRCSYCGERVGDAPVEVQDEVFCSEECLDRFNTGEGEDYFADDYDSDDESDENDESEYNFY